MVEIMNTGILESKLQLLMDQNPPHTISVAIPVCDELSKCFLKMWTGTGCKRLALKSWGLVIVHKGT